MELAELSEWRAERVSGWVAATEEVWMVSRASPPESPSWYAGAAASGWGAAWPLAWAVEWRWPLERMSPLEVG